MTGAVGIVHHRDIPASDAMRSSGPIPPETIETDGKCRLAPIPDKDAISTALAAMFDPEDVIELRAFHKGKKRTDAGYFDGEHRETLTDAAAKLNAAGAAVYVTLNRIDPQLLGRYCNRIEGFASAAATDANVIRRRWLLIDFDPVRPKDTSATDAQLAAAKDRARGCYQFLKAEGWPEPLAGESGNGWHLYYPLDLPNDTESRDLVKGALAGLAARFDDAVVTVDQAVFNAGRITKLFGTVATKGDHTPLAPWRLSRLVAKPKRIAVVTEDQLRALHPKKGEAQPAASFAGNSGKGGDFDLPDFLSRLGIPFEQDTHENAARYKLEHCPFNAEHGKGEAAIFQRSTGALGFKCQHNSCADKGWQDVRALVDGPKEARRGQQATASAPARAEHQPDTGNAPAGDPEPLPALPDVQSLNYGALPPVLRGYVHDIAERMQCPADFAAVACVAMAGTAIGRKIGIRPKRADNWTVIANQWAMIVGRPGIMKSPAMSAALAPMRQMQAEAFKAHESAVQDYEVKAKLAKIQGDEAERSARVLMKEGKETQARLELQKAQQSVEQAPTARRLIINDSTVEALAETLEENPNGILVDRDELVGWLKSLDKEGQQEARAFYLTAAEGDKGFTTDRIGRGRGRHIAAVCVSIVGAIQPGVLASYVRETQRGGSGDDGLLQRFGLVVYPDISPKWKNIDRAPDQQARHAVDALISRLCALDPVAVGAEIDDFQPIPYLRFDPAAQTLFNEWREELEVKVRGDDEHPAIVSHLSKYRKLVPGLALINHLCEGGTGPVTEQALARALTFADYLESHARRVYSYASRPDVDGAKTILAKIKGGKLPQRFKASHVYRPGWSGLTTPEEAWPAIRLLVEYGHLLEIRNDQTGGRPSQEFEAHPSVRRPV